MNKNYTHILVAVDGSKESEVAFEKAITIAKNNDAKLTVAHVLDDRAFKNQGATIFDQANNDSKELLHSLKQKAQELGFANIHAVLEYGPPKAKIVNNIIPELGIDLVICGATGINAFERFFIGSVSEFVVRNAKCDVLISRLNDNQ